MHKLIAVSAINYNRIKAQACKSCANII